MYEFIQGIDLSDIEAPGFLLLMQCVFSVKVQARYAFED